MATVDLWPDEIAFDGVLEGPTVLLKEQAALLGQKTKNLVEGKVILSAHPAMPGVFIDRFFIVCPPLNYRYLLFEFHHRFDFYPADVKWEEAAIEVTSLEELEGELRKIFSDEKTIRIIQALLSRSRMAA